MTTSHDARLNLTDAAVRTVGVLGATDALLENILDAATVGDRTREQRIDLILADLDVTHAAAARILDLIGEGLAAPIPSRTRVAVTPYDAALRRVRTATDDALASGVDPLALAEVLVAAVRRRSLLGREDRADARIIADTAAREDRNG